MLMTFGMPCHEISQLIIPSGIYMVCSVCQVKKNLTVGTKFVGKKR